MSAAATPPSRSQPATSDADRPSAGYPVFLFRGRQVVLDAAVAAGFGVETKRVNEAVARNPAKFGDEHVFVLTRDEFDALRSQTATSKPGRGGARHLPHVFTAKGVARLATVLDTPQALLATDLIIDTFLQVQRQVAAGRSEVVVERPSRLKPAAGPVAASVRDKLARALDNLLDTVIDTANSRSVRQVAGDLGAQALENVRERLRSKGLENAKLEAEATLVLAEAEKVYAEARKAHAEAEGLELDNIPKRIKAVRDLMALWHETEPPEMVRLLTDLEDGHVGPVVVPSLSAPNRAE